MRIRDGRREKVRSRDGSGVKVVIIELAVVEYRSNIDLTFYPARKLSSTGTRVTTSHLLLHKCTRVSLEQRG